VTDEWIAGLYALFVWWFGTGIVLFADKLPRSAHRAAMGVATVLSVGAVYALAVTAEERTLSAALVAFTATVVIWGWHELSFLVGWLTGPRRTPCPPDARGLRRFVYAAGTLIHHEIAIALTGVALWFWLADAANPVAVWTYMILWAMRLSAKLNLFLGAPNVAEEFLPEEMSYLTTYFSKRPMNGLFPISVTAGTLLTAGMALAAAQTGGFEGAALALAATLTGLGTLEHWFLVLPFREAALWRWWMSNRARRAERLAAKRAEGAHRLSALRPSTMLGRG
jgi:putative photosynthetic complex assembly protein 2